MTITSNRRRFLQGTAVLGGIGALAACGQQSSEEQASQAAEENSKAAETAAELPSTAWERADYDAVKDGGTLRLAVSQLPDNWNYSQADGTLADLSKIRESMTGGTKADESGEVTIDPDYLVSAEVTQESPQIVTVKYNPKAVWEDSSTDGWSEIKDIRTTDDEYTGEIEYSSTFPDWISYIFPDIPEAVTKDPKSFNEGYKTEPTPSYGPFVVGDVDQTGQVVTLKRNEKWWGQAPKLETIIYSVVSQQQMPSAFANSELDVIEIADGDTFSQAKSRSDATIQKANGLTWTHVTMNTRGDGKPLNDVKVREAIARAINRDAVGQAVVKPLESPVVTVDNFVFMPGQDGYEDSYEKGTGSKLEYDKDAAGKLLDEAGWTMGSDGKVREKDGEQLKLAVTIPADVKSNSDRASPRATSIW